MHRCVLTLFVAAALFASTDRTEADPLGDSAGARIFDGLLDVDHDGKLDADEIAMMPRIFHTWLARRDIVSATEGLSREEFVKIAPELLGDLRRAAASRRTFATPRRAARVQSANSVAEINEQVVAQARKATAESTEPVLLRADNSGALPAAYRDLDQDGDGQLALSEWTDKLPSEFLEKDQNGDGFLSPRELGASPSSNSQSAGSDGGSSSSTSNAVKIEGVREDVQRRANAVFPYLDKDKDGSITESEWKESRSTRARFERAEVKLSFPVSKEDFVKKSQEVSDKLNDRE